MQDYLASFFGETPWDETQNYRDHSPITYVADVTSPILLDARWRRYAGAARAVCGVL